MVLIERVMSEETLDTIFCRYCGATPATWPYWVCPDTCSACAEKQLRDNNMLLRGGVIVPRNMLAAFLNCIAGAQVLVHGRMPQPMLQGFKNNIDNALLGYDVLEQKGHVPAKQELIKELQKVSAKVNGKKKEPPPPPRLWRPGDQVG